MFTLATTRCSLKMEVILMLKSQLTQVLLLIFAIGWSGVDSRSDI